MQKNIGRVVEKQTRSDKKVDCYPTLSLDLIEQLVTLAERIGKTKTAFAAKVAHWALWNHAVIDQLQPYFQHMVALNWDTNQLSNCFHAWVPDVKGHKDIRMLNIPKQGLCPIFFDSPGIVPFLIVYSTIFFYLSKVQNAHFRNNFSLLFYQSCKFRDSYF